MRTRGWPGLASVLLTGLALSQGIVSLETEGLSAKTQDSVPSATAETTKPLGEDPVSVVSTENTDSDVRTNNPNSDTSKDKTKDYKVSPSETETGVSDSGRGSASVSPTLSAESLLETDTVSETINLGDRLHEVSHEVVQSSQTTASVISTSSETPSIVISVPSMSSSMSSISSSSILPSALTTSAPEEIVTTNPIPDEDLDVYETIPLTYSYGDVRAGQPSTVKIEPTSSTRRMVITTPVYHRANPNRMGILDGEVENDEDHFLSLRAPLNSGGPLNQARSSDADATKPLEKNSRRDDSGPDISDILSGLLNVVGEGLSIATNYVQENNKKKLQEKVSSSEIFDEDEKKPSNSQEENDYISNLLKKNNTRINNRGPPLLSNIPFEAIPLEILSQQRPGARPGVAIPQRPFQTRLPPGISGPPPTLTSPSKGAPFKNGVPLPEQLIPGPTKPGPTPSTGDTDTTTSEEAETGPVLPSQIPTRPDFIPNFDSRPASTAGSGVGRPNQLRPKLPPAKPTSGTKPPLKPVSTDPFIDLLLNEIKEGRITTAPTAPKTRKPSPPSSEQPPVELEPSFAPPLLVTPPSTPRNRPRPPNRRPWPGGRPPRPKGTPSPVKKYPEWKYQNKPPSSFPTPPLNTLDNNKPFVFPSSTSRYRGPQGAIVTGVAIPADNDVFDLTVTAQQNYGGTRKTKNKFRDIITQARPGDQFVSIDGQRTYFDVAPTQAPYNRPNRPQRPQNPTPAGKGSIVGATKYLGGQEVFQPTKSSKYAGQIVGSPLPVESVDIDRNVKPYVPIAKRKPTPSVSRVASTTPRVQNIPTRATRLPPAPPVRIDTCIVGNDATCGQHEICKTYLGVSSCYCKPGYGRKNHRMLCKKTVRLLMSMKIDRVKDDKISWSSMYGDPGTAQYHNLEDEVNYAIGTAMALTSFSNIYMGTKVNKFFSLNGAVTVNTTLEMEENSYTRSEIVKRDIKNKLIEVIQARANNIGSGNLYVSGPFNPIPGVEDFNECSEPEYNDCGDFSVCVNLFGGFTCECLRGYGDKFASDPELSGRHCESCPAEFCSNKGVCSIQGGGRVCECTGNFYGEQCQIDGEVMAVAVGASVAAVIIIILTLVCLCMWSRRWKREQQKTDFAHGFPRSYMMGGPGPGPGYMTKPNYMTGPVQPSPIYTVDNQLRWAHHLDNNGQNIYAQPVVYSGVGPHVFGPGQGAEAVYMAPPEPPRSIYGTLPRGARLRGRPRGPGSDISLPVSSSVAQYATFRRGHEKLGPKVSLKLKQMMKSAENGDTQSIISGLTESSGSDSRKQSPEQGELLYHRVSAGPKPLVVEEMEKVSSELQPEPGRRGLAMNNGRMGPLPSIPRPSTALGAPGARMAREQALIDSSESDTDNSGPGPATRRPRSSLAASNLTLDTEEYDTEFLRYGGTVGVRNPRLVAQMRGVPPGQQQQHIQMNMMGRGW